MSVSNWFRPGERMPPHDASVVTWRNGDWGHGHYDEGYGWFYGCECFPGDEPDYWMIPTSPESET